MRIARAKPDSRRAPGAAERSSCASPRGSKHQITSGQLYRRAIGEGEFTLTLGDDVDAAEPWLIESDAERSTELEPSVRGTLETQFTKDRCQDVGGQRDGRWGFADAHTWSVHQVRHTVDCMATTTTEAPPGTGIRGLDRFAQVKLPVTDLARSVRWYRQFLDLRLWFEIVEDGVLRGAALIRSSASTSRCETGTYAPANPT